MSFFYRDNLEAIFSDVEAMWCAMLIWRVGQQREREGGDRERGRERECYLLC